MGFWHEQSRPDRDDYIQINSINIKPGRSHNFKIRNSFNIDYQGTVYDYKSVLHYSRKSFSKNGKDTITITNLTEYQRQGSPNLGQRSHLSVNDVIQANRLYNCKGSGLHGKLTVHVEYAENIAGNGRVIVYVTAKDDTNNRATKITGSIINNVTSNGTVIFERTLSFGERDWQNVEIYIRTGNHRITPKQTFSVENGRNHHKHCNNVICNTRLYFYTDLVPDEDKCSPNPCRNEEVCTALSSNYKCTCRTEYAGDQCQYRKSFLAILHHLNNSAETNGCFNNSDRYMKAVAIDVNGYNETQALRYSSHNGIQTSYLRFSGWRAWSIIEVSVCDANKLDADCDQLTETHNHTEIMNWEYQTSYQFSLCSKNCSSCDYYDIYKNYEDIEQ